MSGARCRRAFHMAKRCLQRGSCMIYNTCHTIRKERPMLSIRLKPDIEKRLTRLARETGRTKTFYASKLIEENLEDLEDRYLAEARLEKRGKTYTSAQVRSELGLED